MYRFTLYKKKHIAVGAGLSAIVQFAMGASLVMLGNPSRLPAIAFMSVVIGGALGLALAAAAAVAKEDKDGWEAYATVLGAVAWQLLTLVAATAWVLRAIGGV